MTKVPHREIAQMAPRRPPAIFVADALGLDFLNSVATPVDTEVDWIDDGDGLLAWLAQAQLVPAETLETLRAQAMPGELDNVAAQARSLREWFRGFVRQRKGRPLTSKALGELEPLNRLLERDEGFGRIVARRPRPCLRSGVSNDAPMAIAGGAAAADRGSAGEIRLRGRFFKREGVRGAGLHADVRRPHARPCAPMVQHGDLRQPRETGGASAAAQDAAIELAHHRQALRLPVICGPYAHPSLDYRIRRTTSCFRR